MRKLPFLNGIRAFEAAARTGSFKKAADELNVTPAAISRMVHLLEERLGLPLFARKANQLAALTDQVKASAGSRVLTIGVGPTFAIRWLIPRLADFQKIDPDIEVRFATGGAAAPFNDDWTCGIRLGDGEWPGLMAERLFAADLVPVCAPAMARRLATPDDLKRATLLRVTHAPDDWPRWFKGADLPRIAVKGPAFDYYGQALQAAADGVGVAIGIRPYVDDDLRAGRLVAPFAQSVPKGEQWYLIYNSARKDEPSFEAFRHWITQAARSE